MLNLAEQQNALLQALFASDVDHAQQSAQQIVSQKSPQNAIHFIANYATNTRVRGYLVYKSNAQFLAERSLASSYPVIAQLIGEEAFAMLARDLWQQHPPTRGDVAQWGGALSTLVAHIPALAAEPYLADVARIEWALHQAATATNIHQDLPSLSLLTTHEPDAITLQLCPSAVLIRSDFPSASIVTSHLYGSPSFAELGEKLRQIAASAAETSLETALIWRNGMRPVVAVCPAADAMFVQALLQGHSLLSVIESVEDFDFNAWLTQSARSGLLIGASLL